VGEDALVEVAANFGSILAFPDDLITQHIVTYGAHTRVELAFLMHMVDEGDFVFDLGSHIGSFALPLGQRVGSAGKVLAVEGRAETFDVLSRNVARLGLGHIVQPANLLIAPPGRYECRTRDANTGASYFEHVADDGTSLACATVDELSKQYFLPRVLKVDLEGFETFALTGAPELLKRAPIIYAEMGATLLERAGGSLAEIEALLRAHSYRCFKNIGDRNASHDRFEAVELDALSDGGDFFDLLAVHESDERLSRLTGG
jgi:FkbM family methyltransferase